MTQQRPIAFYVWSTPNGHKIAIYLEEAGLPYELKPVNIAKGEQFDPAFLAFSPNNRMPAIIDPDGPDGRPVSVFESGAILQYLGRKTGKLYPADERGRVEVDQWLMWQMAGLGPMMGQAGHFRNYAPEIVDSPDKLSYGVQRYTNEVNRLFGVIERRLADRDYLAGPYSIADIASWPWARIGDKLGQDFAQFPKLTAWLDRIAARPAVQRGLAAIAHLSSRPSAGSQEAKEAAKVLFGQRAQEPH